MEYKGKSYDITSVLQSGDSSEVVDMLDYDKIKNIIEQLNQNLLSENQKEAYQKLSEISSIIPRISELKILFDISFVCLNILNHDNFDQHILYYCLYILVQESSMTTSVIDFIISKDCIPILLKFLDNDFLINPTVRLLSLLFTSNKSIHFCFENPVFEALSNIFNTYLDYPPTENNMNMLISISIAFKQTSLYLIHLSVDVLHQLCEIWGKILSLSYTFLYPRISECIRNIACTLKDEGIQVILEHEICQIFYQFLLSPETDDDTIACSLHVIASCMYAQSDEIRHEILSFINLFEIAKFIETPNKLIKETVFNLLVNIIYSFGLTFDDESFNNLIDFLADPNRLIYYRDTFIEGDFQMKCIVSQLTLLLLSKSSIEITRRFFESNVLLVILDIFDSNIDSITMINLLKSLDDAMLKINNKGIPSYEHFLPFESKFTEILSELEDNEDPCVSQTASNILKKCNKSLRIYISNSEDIIIGEEGIEFL